MPNPRRSIRDIPLTPKQKTAADALKWKDESVAAQPRRDIEEVPDMTEELLREEKPLDQATKVTHIDVREKRVAPKKIKISDGTRPRTKVPKYDIEPAFMSHEDIELSGTQAAPSARKSSVYKSIEDIEMDRPKSSWLKKALFGTVTIAVILFFLLSSVFAHATITIANVSTVETFSNITLPTPITYTALTKNIEKSITVDNPKTVTVQKKASGEVVLYNNFSTAPYELIATTRLETANGSVYRLLNDAKIPGKKTTGGKDVPGTITVKVEADQPGDIYNARPGLELFIPGLIKGTGKYVNIYGKTANQFKGGETGQAIDTSSDQIKASIDTLKTEVKNQVIQEFNQSNPEHIILSDSIQITHAVGAVTKKDGVSEMKILLTVKAIGISKSELSAAIEAQLAEKKVKPTQSSFETLSLTVAETNNDTIVKDKFNILVNGELPLSPNISEGDIISNIVGKSSAEAFAYLQTNMTPGAQIEVSVWPFWKNKIPTDVGKVNLTFE